ncbi:flavodoxin domain-containing protein [Corynebacterium sp. P7202]|uniref:Flavodoxin domain-containing protein n=1 Tax=Corynebacterium pygosceleis TaxID=2800406 RepID=A0A9Q4C9F9_9CORY|nr:flavodoxin domain-containing protein [Corynebacterium pygosceleis]MCK7638050.1 flavodoxin domain-containing protein [Corynebacterium pygosceleis]MCX7468766.1 flavodoxin domain-containing protein [Corynebacterium pygosceleis]
MNTPALTVIFDSVYGSTEHYARTFAKRLGVAPIALSDAPSSVRQLPGTGPVVVFSPNYAGQISGAKWLRDADNGDRPVALVVIGMSVSSWAREKDGAARALGGNADHVTRFYLPGRLNHSQLSRIHRGTLWSLNQMLRRKSNRNENEEEIVRQYGRDIDRVDDTELDPVERWVRGNLT